jgi:AcrR family transcriptional regulator
VVVGGRRQTLAPSAAEGDGRGGPPRPESLTPAQRARRDRIVISALDLLGTEDYDRIQMKDVAERAAVSLGTVYRYFASKEHLFAAAVVAWAGELRQDLGRRPARGESNAERVELILHRAARAFQRQPQFYKAIMVLQVSTDRFAADLYAELSAEILQTLSSVITGLPAEEIDQVVEVCGAVLDVYLRAWSLGRDPIEQVYARLSAAVMTIFEFSDPSSVVRAESACR